VAELATLAALGQWVAENLPAVALVVQTPQMRCSFPTQTIKTLEV